VSSDVPFAIPVHLAPADAEAPDAALDREAELLAACWISADHEQRARVLDHLIEQATADPVRAVALATQVSHLLARRHHWHHVGRFAIADLSHCLVARWLGDRTPLPGGGQPQ
jgi:hypothetical protein